MIATICSSEKRPFRIAPSESGANLSTYRWSENPGAGHRRVHRWSFRTFVGLLASSYGGPTTFFTDPGEYDYHNCEQLAEQRKNAAERDLELKLLMDKAEQGAGGAAVIVIAYQSDYIMAREELKVIDAAARVKNCRLP
jgi:hypothetical protein